jgi:hypothetical protein
MLGALFDVRSPPRHGVGKARNLFYTDGDRETGTVKIAPNRLTSTAQDLARKASAMA